MKKALALILTALMVLSLFAGCAQKAPASSESTPSADTTAPADSEKEIEYVEETAGSLGDADESRDTTKSTGERYDYVAFAIAQDPTDLNPWNKMLGSKFAIYEVIYEQLFDWVGGEYVPSIATGYTVVDDLHYEVEIHDNVFDSEGNHITADDVVACYDNIVASGFAVKFDLFNSVEKVDDYKVLFTWNDVIDGIGDLEHIFCNVQIYSQKAYAEHNFATDPIGTGPYVLKSFTSGSSVVVEANDNYWRPAEETEPWHERNVQTIEFKVVSESATNVIGLQTGDLDFSSNITVDGLADFQDGGAYADTFNVFSILGTGGRYLACNCTEGKITSDKNFRLAVYYAIDNEAVAEAVGNATPSKALGAASNPDYLTAWESEDNYYNYNPELAKEYLAQTDYKGEELVLLGENSEAYKNSMVMIQAQLAAVGINVKIQALDATLVTEYSVDPDAYDLYTNNFGGNPLASGYGRLLNNKEFGTGCAAAFVKDDKLQELFETVSSVNTWNDETMTELVNYVTDNAYYLCMYSTNSNVVCTSDCAEVYIMNSSRVIPNACTYYID